MKKSLLLLTFFALCAVSCDIPYDNGEWNEYTKVYKNTTYNLQWDLSGGNWSAVDKSELPRTDAAGILFYANNEEDMVVAALAVQTSYEGGRFSKNYDIWNHSDEFKDGFIKSVTSQYGGDSSNYNAELLKCEKCEFINRKALRLTFTQEFRYLGYEDFPIKFYYTGYAFIKDGMCFAPMVMITYGYSDFSIDEMESLLHKFDYIEPTKKISIYEQH